MKRFRHPVPQHVVRQAGREPRELESLVVRCPLTPGRWAVLMIFNDFQWFSMIFNVFIVFSMCVLHRIQASNEVGGVGMRSVSPPIRTMSPAVSVPTLRSQT